MRRQRGQRGTGRQGACGTSSSPGRHPVEKAVRETQPTSQPVPSEPAGVSSTVGQSRSRLRSTCPVLSSPDIRHSLSALQIPLSTTVRSRTTMCPGSHAELRRIAHHRSDSCARPVPVVPLTVTVGHENDEIAMPGEIGTIAPLPIAGGRSRERQSHYRLPRNRFTPFTDRGHATCSAPQSEARYVPGRVHLAPDGADTERSYGSPLLSGSQRSVGSDARGC